MSSLRRCRVILITAFCAFACGTTEGDDAQGTAGAPAVPDLPCEPESLYKLGYGAKVALCDQVTSCYGPPDGDSTCYLPAGSSDGGVEISSGTKAPASEVLEQLTCMCQASPEIVSAYTRCAQQADDSLRKCIATCPDDPGACADEYVITCGYLREQLFSLMQTGGDCYQGQPRE